eukprot:gnl/Dysnectes_brevis/1488_a1685_3734.p1 GENE.gnl/Dysnectes_brevis/1488_a1685_3734~~gnl/Dysnectes_brevis/1488_a1685_3734.p1  ORF type:complete len:289 (-),score=51.36 gnl/Dysnectes_brevis/1488_a1685_3734:33-899(-)
MPLYFIGLGLNPKDITLSGLEVAKRCKKLFLESYTSILVSYEEMNSLVQDVIARPVISADRTLVEQHAEEEIIEPAKTEEIAFLVVGDPLCATTHADLILRAHEAGVEVKIIHNASVMTAVGCTGLEQYRFGRVISIPFFTPEWKPDSFYRRIQANAGADMHTLCLLDIKTKEQSVENMMYEREIYEPPRYMLCNLAASQLIEIEEKKAEGACLSDTLAVACMRLGTRTQRILCGTLGWIAGLDDEEMGDPLHCLIVCGNDLSDIEARMLMLWTTEEDAKTKLRQFMQ